MRSNEHDLKTIFKLETAANKRNRMRYWGSGHSKWLMRNQIPPSTPHFLPRKHNATQCHGTAHACMQTDTCEISIALNTYACTCTLPRRPRPACQHRNCETQRGCSCMRRPSPAPALAMAIAHIAYAYVYPARAHHTRARYHGRRVQNAGPPPLTGTWPWYGGLGGGRPAHMGIGPAALGHVT